MKLKVSNKMTNENLKVGDCPICDDQIVLALSMIDVSQVGAVYRDAAVELIKSQQSHIELLESAIREFLDSKKAFFNRSGINVNSVRTIESRYHQAEETLRNLMENKVETVKGRFLHQWAYEAFGRGEELEYIFNNNPNDVWEIVNCNNVLLNIFNASTVSFRLKPQTIQIGSRTINKPISVKPEICTEYFMPSLSSSCKYLYATWNDSNYDKEVLGRSLCHLTKEDAISHCEALLELMK